MTDETAERQALDLQKQRLAALLLTVPGWTWTYTATVETAGWLLLEAVRLGWRIEVTDA